MSIEIIRTDKDPQPRRSLPEQLMNFWPLVKHQWRKNPGFVAATAAGSLGLLLTLAIVIQGGIELLDGPPADDQLTNDVAADLGEPDDSTDGSLTGLFDESSAAERSPGRLNGNEEPEDDGNTEPPTRRVAAADRYSNIENIDERERSRRPRSRTRDPFDDRSPDDAHDMELDDQDEVIAAKKKVLPPTAPLKKPNPLAEAEGSDDADDAMTASESPARSQDDTNPFDDETEAPSRKIRQPVDVVDADEPDEEPVVVAAQPTKSKAVLSPATNGPDLESEGPVDDGFKEDEDPAEPENPVAAGKETPPSGWHNQPSKPLPPAATPESQARQSRAVETTIYAAPENNAGNDAGKKVGKKAENKSEPSPGGKTSPAPRQPENSWLALEIAGPRAAVAGEKCSFEIRLRNTGSATARQLTLSVELPDGLVHEVAQSIEQHIDALPPGQTYRALVRVQAQSSGKATLSADVATGGRVATQLSTAVVVAASPGAASK